MAGIKGMKHYPENFKMQIKQEHDTGASLYLHVQQHVGIKDIRHAQVGKQSRGSGDQIFLR